LLCLLVYNVNMCLHAPQHRVIGSPKTSQIKKAHRNTQFRFSRIWTHGSETSIKNKQNVRGGKVRWSKVSEPRAKQELSFMTSFVNPKANQTLQLTSREVTPCLTYCSANFTTHTRARAHTHTHTHAHTHTHTHHSGGSM
jgi:hypothetical protein